MKHLCPKCSDNMERAVIPSDIPMIPYKWFIVNKDVLNNEVILYCPVCKIYKMLHGFQKIIYLYNPLGIL